MPSQNEPIIIGGCARSGTTLMLAILSCHPTIFAISTETMAFYPARHPMLHSPMYEDNIPPPPPIDISRIHKHLPTFQNDSSLLRWCEKTPKNVLVYDEIINFFKNRVKIINMVRDGRDVVTSYHPNKPKEFYVHPQRWIYDISCGIKKEKNSQIITIRYEDLIANFKETIKNLCIFLGNIDPTPLYRYPEGATFSHHKAWFRPIKPISKNSVGRWKNIHCEKTVDSLMKTPGALECLQHYNYLDS